jgi:uncharacterized ubiquitin-like protein YukD
VHSEDFQKLAKLSPIIDFTNYLMKKFNLRLNREESREKRIGDLFDDPEDGK